MEETKVRKTYIHKEGETVDDNTPMPFGKYKDEAMVNVPASYLIWLYDKGLYGWPKLKAYIVANREVLDVQVSREQSERNSNRRY